LSEKFHENLNLERTVLSTRSVKKE